MSKGAYTTFAARARYRALKESNTELPSFRSWARKTYAEMPVVGKLAVIVGKGDRDAKSRRKG